MLKPFRSLSTLGINLSLAYILILLSFLCHTASNQANGGLRRRTTSKSSSNITTNSLPQSSTSSPTSKEIASSSPSKNASRSFEKIDNLQNTYNHEVGMSNASTEAVTSDLIITPNKPVRFLKLFSVFQFKGFGFMLAKSLMNWRSFGVGVRIPVTANFPKYDQQVYLPRINSLVGCSYPFHVRWTVSVSIPLQVLLFCAYRCFIRANDTLSTTSFIQRLQNPLYTDSYQRIGVSIAIRYNIEGGFKYTIGPWTNYVPSKSSMEKYAVPLLLTPPAVVLTIINIIHPLDTHVDAPAKTNQTQSTSSKQESYENEKISELQLESSKVKSMKQVPSSKLTLMTREAAKRKKKVKRIKTKGIRRRGVIFWHKQMKEWTKLKTIAVSCSLGWFRSQHDVFMGSNVNFDISAFRPFKTYLEKFRRKLVSRIFGSPYLEDEEAVSI
jgi:hypothetical protein